MTQRPPGSDPAASTQEKSTPAPLTARLAAKAQRRTQILSCAAALFARHGFPHVSIDAIGEKAGISGPALYRHFSGKHEILSNLLEGVSERLLLECQNIRRENPDPRQALEKLVAFHVDFALSNADIIRIHDQDLRCLEEQARHRVRRFQRQYAGEWESVLHAVYPQLDDDDLTVRTFATFGLINSTAYSRAPRVSGTGPLEQTLAIMALSALDAPPEKVQIHSSLSPLPPSHQKGQS